MVGYCISEIEKIPFTDFYNDGMVHSFDLSNALLVNLNLQGENLKYSNLENAGIEDCFFIEANLEGVNFENANLENFQLIF